MNLGGRLATRFGAALFAALITVGTLGLTAAPAGAAPPAGSGSISGRVVATGGVPLSGICVGATGGSSTVTDSSGGYSLTGLSAGSYVVQYTDCNPSPTYVTQWYLGHAVQSDADLVNVVDLVDTPLPDVTMDAGVSVSGTVTDSSANPIPNVNVNVNPTGPGPSGSAQTASDGTYTTSPLPSGSYKVQFGSPGPQFAGEYWNDKPIWSAADTLVLDTSGGPVHGGIDAQLADSATIQGTVTDASSTPLSGICVDADTPNTSGGWDGITGTQTLSDGTYALGGLPSIDVRIQFRDCTGGPYLSQWYSSQSDFNSSTPIVLTPGAVRSGIDAQLGTGTSVSGTVTDSGGNPIPNVGVSVNPPTGSGASAYAQTDPSGHYTTNALPPGSYVVQFQSTPTYAGEYWNDKLSRDQADPITIAPGDAPVHGGVDAVLAVGATVSGRVTGPTGAPLQNICVDSVIDTSSGRDGLGGTTTASDGTYTITGLPATTLKIVFRDCNNVGPYVQEWWNDQTNPDAATAITLAPGDARTGVDAQLAAAGAISGTVTDGGGHPLAGICAQATTSTFVGGLATTDSGGHYSITLAAAGDYRVQFVDCSGSPAYAAEWWNNAASAATAQTVHVATGATVPGIDASLAPGAAGSISGKVVNASGAAMTGACVVAYLPNQFAVFGLVQADGSFTIPNVPSGTYALAFLGCGSGGNPQPIVPDPNVAGVNYAALWWKDVPLTLTNGGGGDGGPDPIAQGANLVTVTPGANLTGYDVCFGCGSITITSITPGPNSLTVAFTIPDFSGSSGSGGARAAAITTLSIVYTVTCTSPRGGVSGSASGPGSPITVTGLTAGASYACRVTADSGGTLLATSGVADASIAADPTPGGGTTSGDPASNGVTSGSLPRTGAGSPMTLVRDGVLLIVFGCALAAMARGRDRRHGLEGGS